MQRLLQGGTLVLEQGLTKADLLIEGEKIKTIAPVIATTDLAPDARIIDVQGKIIMPGIIDAHTHYQLRSRNTVTADDFFSGSVSAAYGGVTTFVDYADHRKDCTLVEAGLARVEEALGQTVLDFTLHQTITHFTDKVSRELADLRDLGINSIKIFTTYRREGYMIPDEEWERVFQRLKEEELLLTVHAEDDALIMQLEAEYQSQDLLQPCMHPRIRPAEAEGRAVAEVGELARQVGLPIYIAHLSSAAGLQALKAVKAAGGLIYAETTPHYLLLDESVLSEPKAQKYVMTPPLRTKADQQALWQGLKDSDIQVVATDHCAFDVAQKLAFEDCLSILPGLPGSETMFPLLHHFGVGAGFDYRQLVQMLSTMPAKIFGLYPQKGSLLPGTDADIVVFDPEKVVRLADDIVHSKASYTPFAGIEVRGYPIMTILRGKVLVENGTFIGQRGGGQFVKGERSSLFGRNS